MRHTIPVEQLKVGMYVADPGPDWVAGGLYPVEGFIAAESDLQFILQSGSPRAVIDPARSRSEVLPPEVVGKGEKEAWRPKGGHTPPAPTTSMKDELSVARAVYSDSISRAKELMDGVREGRLMHPGEAEPVVGGIVESLDNNSDALFGLCKLRQVDEYTYSHCANVSVLAVMFARKLGASKEMQHVIGLGGLFHDIGKSKIPVSIINAPRKLTDKEFEVMQHHPPLGYEQLEAIPGLPKELLQIVVEHHEKADGTGYPKGLKESEISHVGALVGIADVFDALTSKRSYKDAMPLQKAHSILYSMRGTHFPAAMVDSFIQMVGLYPLGSPVKLSDGRLGLVSATSLTDPVRPKVIVLRDARGRSVMQEEIDLGADRSVTIEAVISQKELGVEATAILGIPTAVKR